MLPPCLLAAGLLAVAWPLEQLGEEFDVVVEATGERHPDAARAEVWVRVEVDGAPLPVSALTLGPGWVVRDGFAAWSSEGEPSAMRWRGRARRGARLVFATHPWSGGARVRWLDRVEEFGLYALPAGPDRVVELSPPTGAPAAWRLPRSGGEWLIEALEFLVVAMLLLGVLAFLTRPPAGPTEPVARSCAAEGLLLATPLGLVSGWLLALYAPGLMTVDSVDQWWQAQTLRLDDGHPVFYALVMAGLRRAWDSPASVALLQVLAMSVATSFLVAVVGRRLRAPFWARSLGALAVALHPESASFGWMPTAHRIAAHLAAGHHPASPGDQRLLRAVLDVPDWNYSCASVNPTVFAAGLDRQLAVARSADLARIWRELALRWPQVELEHQLCLSSLVWRLDVAGVPGLYLYTVALESSGDSVRWITPGDHPPRPQPATLFPQAARALGQRLLRPGRWWLWQPAVFLYALVLAALVARSRSGSRGPLALLVVPLAHSAVLALVTPAQDARYQLPIYVLALGLVPVLLASGRAPPGPVPPERPAG